MSINLTRLQFSDLITKRKKIGEGTDGACYKQGNKVYKIYHTAHKARLESKVVLDSSGVRIPNKDDYKNMMASDERIIRFTDAEGTKLSTEAGLLRAIELGNKIKGSNLPSDIVYVNGIARGCVYPYYRFVSSIYKSYRKRFKTRLKICSALYVKVKELINHNIYPIDLAQKGKESLFDKRYCNVLLSFNNEPIIIDLDGKSALYTEISNPYYEKLTCNSLMTLILEIMTREDLQEDINDDDIDTVMFYLKKNGLSKEIIEKYLDCSMTMEDVCEGLEEIGREKIK